MVTWQVKTGRTSKWLSVSCDVCRGSAVIVGSDAPTKKFKHCGGASSCPGNVARDYYDLAPPPSNDSPRGVRWL